MAFQDKTLKCKDCGVDFVFTAGEQEFYEEKGFENEPARCRECRDAKKRSRDGGERTTQREMHEVICAGCGITTQVPFKPRNDRPVYCRECFNSQRNA
jgi:CxxC-x17-CxxC domain-containing protein